MWALILFLALIGIGVSFFGTNIGLHAVHHSSTTKLHKALEKSEAALTEKSDTKTNVDGRSVRKQVRHEGNYQSGASSAP